MNELRYGTNGLIPVTVIDPTVQTELNSTGGVLMAAHANDQAVERTLVDGYATFWSRSKSKLWRKGEESGNLMIVRAVFGDCDWDALLYNVVAPGASCHKGTFSCFEMVTIGELE